MTSSAPLASYGAPHCRTSLVSKESARWSRPASLPAPGSVPVLRGMTSGGRQPPRHRFRRERVTLPDGVPDELVAGLGLSAIAAWMSLTWRAPPPGESVLVLGAGGVVGQVALQAARILGAGRVVAAARVPTLGNARCRMPLTTLSSYVPTTTWRASPPASDRPVATSSSWILSASRDQLQPRCWRKVVAGQPRQLSRSDRVRSATLRSRSAAILGYTNNSLTKEQRSHALTSLLRRHAAEGSLTVDHETVEWGDLPDAWARQADGQARRRIVVRIS